MKVLAALLVVFGILEAGVRMLGLGVPPRGPDNRLAIREGLPDAERVGEVLVPGAVGEVLYPGYGQMPERVVEYRVSSQRLRDREFALEKPPGSYRILCIGDSVTYGTGVDLKDSYPKQLERLLQERFAPRQVEVLNGGIYATNTSQQVAWLRHGLLRFHPDLVLVATTLPDASGKNIAPREHQAEPLEARLIKRLGLTSGIWEGQGEGRTPAIQRTLWLRRHSKLIDLVSFKLYGVLKGRQFQKSYHLDWAEGSAGRESVSGALWLLSELAKHDRFDVLVSMYPNLDRLNEQYPFRAEIQTLAALCKQQGLEFLDLLPPLYGQNAKALQVHAHDHHPNAFAHGLVARFLVEQLAPRIEGWFQEHPASGGPADAAAPADR